MRLTLAPGYHDAIRLCKRQSKMRRFDFCGDFRAQLREKFGDYVVARQSIRILWCEIFFANHSARVDEEEAGKGHPLVHPFSLGVKHMEPADNFGIGIGQQWKINIVPFREILRIAGLS